MEILESVEVAGDRNFTDLRFPVQYVNRPNLNFRGFAGTLASGIVRKGDEVVALPSGKGSKVKSIVTYEGEMEQASPGQAITLMREEEHDRPHGDVLVYAVTRGQGSDSFEARLVCVGEEPKQQGEQYHNKRENSDVPRPVASLRQRVDGTCVE